MTSFQDLLGGGQDTNTNTDANDTSNSIKTFVSSVCINIAIALLLFLAFCILRPRFRRVYAPRTYAVEKARRSEPVGTGLFSWIPAALRVPDREIIKRVGLDTYMFLRTIRTMFIMFLAISVLSAGTMLPVNILGTKGQTGLNALSMGNVDEKSPWLWVHVGFFAISVLWTLRCIVGELRIYTQLRMWWLTHPENAAKAGASTILVSHVPETLTRKEHRLRELFDEFPGGVRQVFVNRSSKELAASVKKRDKLAKKLEKTLTAYAVQCTKAFERAAEHRQEYVQPPRPMLRKKLLGVVPCVGTKVEAIEYYASEMAMCNHFIAQSSKDLDHFVREPSALVMFNKPVAAHMAAQTVLDYRPFSMSHVSVDVHPDDILWSNLKMSPWDKRIRGYVSFIITVGLTAVWTLITAFLSGLVQVKNLAQLKAFSWLQGNAWAFGVFSGIVPSAVLALLMLVLPSVLRLLLRLEGTPRRSLINLRLLHRLYFFQVWNVYLVTIFSSSILVIVANSIDKPDNIISLLQTQVPQSATNILTYVVLLAFIGAAKEITQGVRLAVRYLVPLLFAKTPRALYKAELPKAFDWGEQIPTHSLVFLMGFSYSLIAPIVAWFVMVYFGLFYVIYRYQFLYVYNDKHWVTGGLSFPKAVKQMLVAVYISEVYMVLMMVSKLTGNVSSILRIAVSAAVLALTIVVHLYINDVYMPSINYLPVKKAKDVERNPRRATDFPDVMGGYHRKGQRDSGARESDPLAAEKGRARNHIYAMYSSLVPVCIIDLFLWMFPCALQPKSHQPSTNNTNGWDLPDVEEGIKETRGFACNPQMSQRRSRISSMVDRRPQASMADNELACEFSNPAVRAKPVCNLWVPLANARLFARLLWEVEYYGQGTILVITHGTWIDQKSLKVKADLDFVIEDHEVSDKTELVQAQQSRPHHS
ncbi:phosphate metabolism protein 7 [Coemansia sp. RSA 1813]|nr:phosphate metabolism protein 7 [Coemansia sp. RSA 1646]KAJ1768888.1 phosphate metabolism protein 7 [Coemansia sp. RSA 1843]KAJ2091060.1 phosphate metabolism protein 7 [Coemansia sp. RSA 986]KAJ2215968.1 phosphate metabolism protein 7 [Coemansia sp. RSA 487]KAJ2570186.1 phosphate metabolism protein 7 [Coemansia sp. RSA 1813]